MTVTNQSQQANKTKNNCAAVP